MWTRAAISASDPKDAMTKADYAQSKYRKFLLLCLRKKDTVYEELYNMKALSESKPMRQSLRYSCTIKSKAALSELELAQQIKKTNLLHHDVLAEIIIKPEYVTLQDVVCKSYKRTGTNFEVDI